MIAAEIIIAVFAVWGMYSALKLISELWLMPKKIRPVPTVRLDGTETDGELLELYRNAGEMWVSSRNTVVFVLPETENELNTAGDAGVEERLRRMELPGARVVRGFPDQTN